MEKKGDLVENENHQKNNCLITKLVYIHEGIEKEAPKSKRHKLVNPHYFCGTSCGEENSEFWDEQAVEKVYKEYDIFNKTQPIESDFDKIVKGLEKKI